MILEVVKIGLILSYLVGLNIHLQNLLRFLGTNVIFLEPIRYLLYL